MRIIVAAAAWTMLSVLACAATPKADLDGFRKAVEPVLKRACVSCHGPDKQKGKFRVDTLDPDLLNGADVSWWLEVFGVIGNGEMPPEDAEVHLQDAHRAVVVDWLSREIQQASRVARSAQGRSSFRRLTRYEYDYALRDLLGLDHSLVDRLPPETASEDGFKNSSELLQMSSMQFQTYREIGLKALRRAIVIGDQPKPVKYLLPLEKLFEQTAKSQKAKVFRRDDKKYASHRRRAHLLNRETGVGVPFSGGMYRPLDEAAAAQVRASSKVYMELPRNNEWKVGLDRFLPDEGTMRISIRAARSTEELKGDASLRLGFSAHTSNNANFSNVISERDVPVKAPAGKPEFIHFDIQLDDIQRNPFRKLETTFPRRDEFLHIRNVTLVDGLHVQFDHVEITAPFYAQWPPKTHTAIFFESGNRENETVYAREVLERFMGRAWRRPVGAPEVDRFVKLFGEYRPQFESFEGAMVEVLATVLAHPEFLYLAQRDAGAPKAAPTGISEFELAGRLAVFLWSSIPDEPLLDLAQRGKLREPKMLAAQVDRMLADPRAKRFTRHFIRQWLGLDGLNSVDHIQDDQLRTAMAEEPIAFFEHVLQDNGSIMDFIHSDYAVVNAKLAQLYRIPDVHGLHFRKVALEAQHQRGGLMRGGVGDEFGRQGFPSPQARGLDAGTHAARSPAPASAQCARGGSRRSGDCQDDPEGAYSRSSR